MKRDIQATEAAHFANKKSYIAPDGREVLYGKDWIQRKAELWARCDGRCERMVIVSLMPNVSNERCRSEAQDPHHIIRRSQKRDDRLANLEALCRLHHDLLDKRKPRWGKKGGRT